MWTTRWSSPLIVAGYLVVALRECLITLQLAAHLIVQRMIEHVPELLARLIRVAVVPLISTTAAQEVLHGTNRLWYGYRQSSKCDELRHALIDNR